MTGMAVAIAAQDLTKVYPNKVRAVDRLNLTVEEGDIYGFVGPNGAGKTTTIRMFATLLRPTSGKAFVFGHDVEEEREEVRRIIGYVPDSFGVYDRIKVWEYLDFFASAYGIPKSARRRAIKEALELTDLTEKREDYVESLSRGMQQRLLIAKTLLHDPKVFLMDEPLAGLDPRARVEVRELLKELGRMGRTIFVSSHILADLEDICNKIGIIERGRLLVSAPIEELAGRVRGARRIRIEVLEGVERAERLLKGREGVHEVRVEGNVLRADVSLSDEELAELVSAMAKEGVKVASFGTEPTDLEEVFIRITKGELG